MRRLSALLLVAVLAASTLFAQAAIAKPVAWSEVNVLLHPEDQGGVLLVSGTLPDSVTLPAEAELSVTAGSNVLWIGEILGGDPSADPKLNYTKRTEGGSDIYTFTLTKSHKAQVEISSAGAVPIEGGRTRATIGWKATTGVPKVELSVRIPQTATIVEAAEGAQTGPGESGYVYYGKSFSDVKAGDELALGFTYSAPAAPAPTTPASDGTGFIIGALVIGVLVIGGLILAFNAGRTSGTRTAEASPAPAAKRKDAAPKATESDEAVFEDEDYEDEDEDDAEDEASGARPQRTRPPRSAISTARLVMTFVFVGVVGIGMVALFMQASKPKLVGDTVSQIYAPGEACATANITLTIPAGTDPAAAAGKILAALKKVDGMNNATVNVKTNVLEAGYCESKTTEAAVRAAVAATGLASNEGQ